MWSEQIVTGEFPAVEALTKDGLKVNVDITVGWRFFSIVGGVPVPEVPDP